MLDLDCLFESFRNPKAFIRKVMTMVIRKTGENSQVETYENEEANMRIKQAREYLELLYSKEEYIWVIIQTGGPEPSKKKKEGETKKKVEEIDDKFLSKYANIKDYEIYVTLNTFRKDSTKMLKSQIEPEQDKMWLDLDSEKLKTDAKKVLEKILQETGLPRPTIVIRTSQTRYGDNLQVIWKFKEKVDFRRLSKVIEELGKVIEELGGGYELDHTQDKVGLFRLAGFNNEKTGKTGKDPYSVIEINEIYDIKVLETLKKKFSQAEKEEKQIHTQDTQVRPPTQSEPLTQTKSVPTQTPTQLPPAPAPKQSQTQRQQKKEPSYAELLMLYARKKLNLNIDLTSLGPDESKLDFAFCRELLRLLIAGIPPGETFRMLMQGLRPEQILEQATQYLHFFLLKERPEKLKESPEYAKLTVEEAYRSLIKEKNENHMQFCLRFLQYYNIFQLNLDPEKVSYRNIHIAIAKSLAEEIDSQKTADLLMQILTKTFRGVDKEKIEEYVEEVIKSVEVQKSKFIEACQNYLRNKGYDVDLSRIWKQSYKQIYKSIALKMLEYKDVSLEQVYEELKHIIKIKARCKDESIAEQQAKQAVGKAFLEKLDRSKDYPRLTAKKAHNSLMAEKMKSYLKFCLNHLKEQGYSIQVDIDPTKASYKDIHTAIADSLIEIVDEDMVSYLLMDILKAWFKDNGEILKNHRDKVMDSVREQKKSFFRKVNEYLQTKDYKIDLSIGIDTRNSYRDLYVYIARAVYYSNSTDREQIKELITELIKFRKKDETKAQLEASQIMQEIESYLEKIDEEKQQKQEQEDDQNNQNNYGWTPRP